MQGCFDVEITGSISQAPLSVRSRETATATAIATLQACAELNELSFSVTTPSTGYSAELAPALDLSAESVYDFSPGAINTKTLDIIVSATGASTEVVRVPINVILQGCFDVEITGSISQTPLSVRSGETTATVTATLQACAELNELSFSVTTPSTGYSAELDPALDLSAESVYDFSPGAINTKTLDIIVRAAGENIEAGRIPINVTLQGCFDVEITGSISQAPLSVRSRETATATATAIATAIATLQACAELNELSFSVTTPSTGYSAELAPALDLSAESVYDFSPGAINTKTLDIIVSATGASTEVVRVPINVILQGCFDVEITGSISQAPLSVRSGETTATVTATLQACAELNELSFSVTTPSTGYSAELAPALDLSAESVYDFSPGAINTKTLDIIVSATGASTEVVRVPINVILQGCFDVEITGSISQTPLSVRSGETTATVTATLQACAELSFSVTTPSTGYSAELDPALDLSAESVYDFSPGAINTKTLDIIVRATGASTEVGRIPINVTLQECFVVEITGSISQAPLSVRSRETTTVTATLQACAELNELSFSVTTPSTGYSAELDPALDLSAESVYDFSLGAINTKTLAIIVRAAGASTEAGRIPINVIL